MNFIKGIWIVVLCGLLVRAVAHLAIWAGRHF